MTGNDVYKAAIAIMSQQPADITQWQTLAIQWINISMYEVLNVDNSIRIYEGKVPQYNLKRITALTDTLPIHERLFSAMVNLLAAFMWTDQDEGYKAQDCRSRAAAELQDCVLSRQENIMDVYWGGDKQWL